MAQVALVSGGARGIGRAVVERLAQAGWQVAMTFLPGVEQPEALADLPASLHPLDLRNPASIRACQASVVAQHGGIDALVNNAAVGSATVEGFASDLDAQDAAMISINATGTLTMCRAFLSHPAATPGVNRKIVNLSSVGGGIAAFPGFSLADGMSKSAVAHLTRQLAAEAVHLPLDVFAICPGATDTEMFRQSTLNRMSPEQRAAFLQHLPKGRLIAPAEIADVVAFLVSPAGSVLHGAVIDASMGLGVRPGLISETGH